MKSINNRIHYCESKIHIELKYPSLISTINTIANQPLQ